MIAFFHATLYQPLYNGLIFLIDIIPGADVGLAVLALTIIVKLILLPLSEKAVATQLIMKKHEPELSEIKLKYKDKKEDQARAILDFYKSHKINPFASILVILVQIPIIISLYYVFFRGGLPIVNTELLYSFVPVPQEVDMFFLGYFDMAGKTAFLALLVGVTQFFQMRLAMPVWPTPVKKAGPPSLKDEMMKSLQFQMRYVLPIFVAVVAYNISGAVALYWTTSNLFAIGQELYLRRKFATQRAELTPQTK
jgi:YidC/Oxa1 family membrane protein insertase